MKRRLGIAQPIREEVIRRSHGSCAVCGRDTTELQIDHILPVSAGGDDSFDNLQAVCPSCHVALHREGSQPLAKLRASASKAYEFERAVADIFGQMGYAVMRGATGPDGGVDIAMRKTIGGIPTLILVECKYTVKPLSVSQISDFYKKVQQYRGNVGIIVTNRSPTAAALAEAKRTQVRTVTLDDLKALASDMETEDNG